MSKVIWIINEYAGSPYHGMEFRHYYIAKELVKRGYSVSIISASYSHLFKNLPPRKSPYCKEVIDGVKYYWLPVNNYGTSHDKRRVIKWLKYSIELLFLPTKELDKPDLIVVSPMATFPVYPAYRLAKKLGAKLVYEIKDIWPLSLVEIGGYSERNLFIRILAWFERFGLLRADQIVSNLPNYGKHIEDIGIKRKFTYIPNGVDLDEIRMPLPLNREILNQFPEGKFIVGYLGTLGVANALEYLIEAAELLEVKNKVHFVLVGDGQEKEKLVKRAKGLGNVTFIPFVDKRQVQSVLEKFDACYIGLRKEKLFEYGVSPNKLFDYMVSGRPIIHAIDTGKNIVEKAKCGVSVSAEDSTSVANGVMKLLLMSEEERKRLGENGREYVLANHTYDQLATKYEELLL